MVTIIATTTMISISVKPRLFIVLLPLTVKLSIQRRTEAQRVDVENTVSAPAHRVRRISHRSQTPLRTSRHRVFRDTPQEANLRRFIVAAARARAEAAA